MVRRTRARVNTKIKKAVPEAVIVDYEAFKRDEVLRRNNLIGDYLGEDYVIPEEIKKELILAPKLATLKEDDYILCTLTVLEYTLKFRLEYREYDKLSEIAELYLLEDKDGVTLKTFLADYVDSKSPQFKQNARISFAIFFENEEVTKTDLSYLKERFEENKSGKHLPLLVKKYTLRKELSTKDRSFVVEMYSEMYVLAVIALLKKSGPLGLKILEKYQEMVDGRGYLTGHRPNIYTTLRECIDTAIIVTCGFATLASAAPEYTEIVESFQKPVKEFDELSSNIRMVETQIEKMEPKAATKSEQKKVKAAPSASSSGKKSASKPKSAPKKAPLNKKGKNIYGMPTDVFAEGGKIVEEVIGIEPLSRDVAEKPPVEPPTAKVEEAKEDVTGHAAEEAKSEEPTQAIISEDAMDIILNDVKEAEENNALNAEDEAEELSKSVGEAEAEAEKSSRPKDKGLDFGR